MLRQIIADLRLTNDDVTPSAVEGSGCKCKPVSVRAQMSRLRCAALDMTKWFIRRSIATKTQSHKELDTNKDKTLPAAAGKCLGAFVADVHPPVADKLMAGFQTRLDWGAFEQIVSYYMRPALAVARQVLSDSALAEDAVQESFLRLIRKRHQYVPGRDFSCWFYAIVRNVCLDMLRQSARQKELIEQVAAKDEPNTPRTDSSEIPELLDVLAHSERDVLVLRIVHGLGFRDVAAALGISEEAAKKRAQRGLRRLRAAVCDSQNLPGKLPVVF